MLLQAPGKILPYGMSRRLTPSGSSPSSWMAVSLDSIMVKVHPDGTGALRNGPQAIGRSCGVGNTKMHLHCSEGSNGHLSPGRRTTPHWVVSRYANCRLCQKSFL